MVLMRLLLRHVYRGMFSWAGVSRWELSFSLRTKYFVRGDIEVLYRIFIHFAPETMKLDWNAEVPWHKIDPLLVDRHLKTQTCRLCRLCRLSAFSLTSFSLFSALQLQSSAQNVVMFVMYPQAAQTQHLAVHSGNRQTRWINIVWKIPLTGPQ